MKPGYGAEFLDGGEAGSPAIAALYKRLWRHWDSGAIQTSRSNELKLCSGIVNAIWLHGSTWEIYVSNGVLSQCQRRDHVPLLVAVVTQKPYRGQVETEVMAVSKVVMVVMKDDTTEGEMTAVVATGNET